MEKVPMTRTGFTRMEEELKRLKGVERPAVIQALEEARAHGDLSENAEYHAAKERQAFIESRVADLGSKVSRAQIIDTSTMSGKTVKFGATVTVVDEDDDSEMKFQIVGEDEADIKAKRLSVGSPLARALIGKQVGDEVEVATPSGGKFYELLKLQYV
ncbi:MAG: transcription elongation factor GreA [Rhodospirillaceae bacterium]|jgi:transcription elongation factor GreA|nr:transcription elongation factor GreA [Rhodospirillaceae bacterium]MBT4489830.1 transcription elongation factor GreA [Rhodospirillaceae bacterium]MBT5192304.1 transcription elongation factor GreA [Rhodospirillaceae bacterium]MBT5894571.1 transcription elongation factor GreA [Rhodospirillaceae bacterium]MBT6430855.1 transcription elongation factor GreA [Rhodospirillaceae bacterium]